MKTETAAMTTKQFEAAVGLSGYACAKLLHVSKSKWSEWSSAIHPRALPPYVHASMLFAVELHRLGKLAPFVKPDGRTKAARGQG